MHYPHKVSKVKRARKIGFRSLTEQLALSVAKFSVKLLFAKLQKDSSPSKNTNSLPRQLSKTWKEANKPAASSIFVTLAIP